MSDPNIINNFTNIYSQHFHKALKTLIKKYNLKNEEQSLVKWMRHQPHQQELFTLTDNYLSDTIPVSYYRDKISMMQNKIAKNLHADIKDIVQQPKKKSRSKKKIPKNKQKNKLQCRVNPLTGKPILIGSKSDIQLKKKGL